MEKILSDDEKIRKAEEIYCRRNNNGFANESNKKKIFIKDKIFLHLLIMFNIAIIVVCIQNKEYIFTNEFLNKLNEYNINISSNFTNYIKKIISDNNSMTNSNDINNDITNTDEIDNDNITNTNYLENENITTNYIDNDAKYKQSDNVLENNSNNAVNNNVNNSILSDDDIDIQNLKGAYSFINPIEGVITSRFGVRNSENKNIDGYHTGLDIASDKGTIICASMQGIVDEVSSIGDYGNHIKIRCNNVTTLYAHCENIYVTQGQIVYQGQTIGTVGSTGNSTGPHLHFEIRIDDRFINPEKILNI